MILWSDDSGDSAGKYFFRTIKPFIQADVIEYGLQACPLGSLSRGTMLFVDRAVRSSSTTILYPAVRISVDF